MHGSSSLEGSRRQFLQSTGLAMVAAFVPASARGRAPQRRLTARSLATPFIYLSESGRLGVVVDKSEMGQGVTSLYPTLAAEQLEMNPQWLEFRFADVDKVYNNAKIIIPFPVRLLEAIGLSELQIPMQMTGLSTATADAWEKIPPHARGVYALLMETAARDFGVPAGTGRMTEYGIEGAGTNVPYATLVQRMGTQPIATVAPTLRQLKWMGAERTTKPEALRRHDVVEKVLGKAKFASDVTHQDFGAALMFNAVVVRPRERGARVSPENASTVMRLPGIRNVFTLSEGAGVVVVAETYWQARQAAQELQFYEFAGPNRNLSDRSVRALYRQILDGAPAETNTLGDARGVQREIARASERLQAEYSVPYVPHVTMEPMTASAQMRGGTLVLWVATQFPDAVRALAAEKARISESNVELHQCYLGGGFGRRLYSEHVENVVEIALLTRGVPVKLTYSREDDIKNDFYRPMAVHRVEAGFSGTEVRGWKHDVATQSLNAFIVRDYLAALISSTGFSGLGRKLYTEKQIDAFSHEGAETIPYAMASHVLYSHQPVGRDAPQMPVGFWRSVGHSHTAFAKECFVDELANAMGEDPLSWRLVRSTDAAERKCLLRLQTVLAGEDLSTWGLALHSGWGSHCAMAAQVELVEGEGVRVRRVVTVVDCGFVVQPDQVRAQIEGAVAFGLSAALKQEIQFENGVVAQNNFYDSDILRMFEAPDVEVLIMPHGPDRAPTGVGELGVPPVAPAVANALYRTEGIRVRDLPLTWEKIAALRAQGGR